MRNILKLMVFALLLLTACGKSSKETSGDLDSLKTKNQALYNQTMDIHDEVMPKMDNLYRLKKSLQDTLTKTPAMPAAAKARIEARVHLIDSASNAMMVWMRQFNPSDSTGTESYRIYMEQELEKVKQVRSLMLEALNK